LPPQPPPIRILTILEAHSITGPTKAILEFNREAVRSATSPRIELSVLTFLRGGGENSFTRAIRAEGMPLDIVAEKGRFDRGVIPQLRAAVARRQPHIIWTNAVKSHFLIRSSGLHKSVKWVAFHHGYTTTHWSTRLYNQLDRWSLFGAERLVTVCGPFAAQLSARGIPRERIHVEHMPIRTGMAVPHEEASALRRQFAPEPGTQILLSVGRLSQEKGHAELLRAMAAIRKTHPVPPVRLVLAGDGPEAASLKALCSELNLRDSVIFAGHQTDVRPFYAMADVFVLPSHSEGSPNVLLEAMDANLPIVATAVGGIPEMVTSGETALLTPARDVEALSASLLRMLADRPLRLRLADAARAVLLRHSPERYFQNLAAVFRDVAAQAPRNS
jgi:glycosyltransferase involved in cell wall biosynthesis